MEEKDIIYLLCGNVSTTYRIASERPENVELDLRNGTWKLKNWGRSFPIGDGPFGDSLGSHEGDVLGVYDRTNNRNLEIMLFSAASRAGHAATPTFMRD